VRPRGPCGKCTQAEANLLKQAQNRRGRRLKNLARLARVDPKLLYPLRQRGEESQAHIALIRSRDVLVSSRTQLVNPGYVGRSNPSEPGCPSALPQELPQEGRREHIPEALLAALAPVLEQR
jgi:hypothetical protein